MKKYLLLVLFISVYTLVAANSSIGRLQDSIKIDFIIKNKDSGRMELTTPAGRKSLDLKRGRASISLKLDRVCEILLFTDPGVRDLGDSSIVRFLVQFSDMTVSLSIINGKAENIRIIGSKAQSELEDWKNQNYDLLKAKETVRNERNQVSSNRSGNDDYSSKKLDSLNSKLQSIYNKLGELALRLVETNPDSYAGAYLLLNYRTIIPQDSLEKYYLKLSPSVQQALFSVALFDQLYTLSGNFRSRYDNIHAELKKAQSVFDFTLPDLNERSVRLSKFRGKPLLLFFWATWCGPCHSQAPEVNELMNEFKNDSITFISVSLDKDPEDFKKSDKKIDLPCITLLDSDNTLRYFYKFLYVPTYILLDHNGKIILNDTSNYTLSYEIPKAIEQYIKKETHQ